jgi:hypothetical protein
MDNIESTIFDRGAYFPTILASIDTLYTQIDASITNYKDVLCTDMGKIITTLIKFLNLETGPPAIYSSVDGLYKHLYEINTTISKRFKHDLGVVFRA